MLCMSLNPEPSGFNSHAIVNDAKRMTAKPNEAEG
jgi:hypothetical protein